MNDDAATLLAVARLAMRPETRRDIPAAFALAWRFQRLDPLPAGFVPITEAEAGAVYFDRLRPKGHAVPSLDGVAMTETEAAAIYRERIRRA